ncbi:MAG: hypothetical protein QGH74_03130 [Candidatus Brocadiia bacterium]|nr:hypothetical protein [Candidatus Brocadiia bacterium]
MRVLRRGPCRALAMWVGMALALAAAGCGGARRSGPAEPPLEGREAALVRRARVQRITDESDLPQGPGAEGQVGDYLIENALVRFVVGGEGRGGTSPQYEGALIDAAVRGGEDRLRLLASQVGGAGAGDLVCDEVSVIAPSGETERASLQVKAHLAGDADVRVLTTYRLAPSERDLTIVTDVENGSERTLAQVALGDVIYHGRTERCAQGLGLAPLGRPGSTGWLSFFGGGYAWGLRSADGLPAESFHERGRSRLVYAEKTIPAGESRTYTRVLTVRAGDPALIASLAPVPSGTPVGALTVRVVEIGSERPVVGAYISLASRQLGAAALGITDGRGEASFRLREAHYELTCRAPGRSTLQLPLGISGRVRQLATLQMSRRAVVRVRVREATPDGLRPTSARITVHPGSANVGRPVGRPLFSGAGGGRTALVPESGEIPLPLAPGVGRLPATYRLVASKGSQHELAEALVRVAPGKTMRVEFTLRRVVDTSGWAAVDFLQRCDEAPDSALKLEERALLNRAEGLDAAVLVRHWPTGPRQAGAEATGRGLLPALRVATPHTRGFTVLPLSDEMATGAVMLTPPARWGKGAEEVFGGLRAFFPRALFCLDAPADDAQPSEHFDAVFLLTGGDTLKARRHLKRWFGLLNRGRRIVALGGSGSGSAGDLPALSARTFVATSAEGGNLREVIRSLGQRPNAVVSNGPFLEVTANGQPIGSTVRSDGGRVNVRVRVLAPEWMDVARVRVFSNGAIAHELKVGSREGALALERTVEVAAERDGWIVVVATGDRAMTAAYSDEDGLGAVPFAVTNPFWIDADGDGLVSLGGQ